MKKYIALGIFILPFLINGCKTAPVKKEAPPPPTLLNKTFGEISYLGQDGYQLDYKSMRLLLNPTGNAGDGTTIDYVLLSGVGARSFPDNTSNRFRKNIKIVVHDSGQALLSQKGFSQVKGIRDTQKLMLKKEDGFIFANAVGIKTPDNNDANGYFLEFDNGRHVLISPDFLNADSYREFVYGIRDDGKEIHLAFLTCEEMGCAEAVALLQPKIAVLNIENAPEDKEALRASLNTYFQDNFFDGQFLFTEKEVKIPF